MKNVSSHGAGQKHEPISAVLQAIPRRPRSKRLKSFQPRGGRGAGPFQPDIYELPKMANTSPQRALNLDWPMFRPAFDVAGGQKVSPSTNLLGLPLNARELPKIFISYCGKDPKIPPLVQQLATRLESQGFTVLHAMNNPKEISWSAFINQALRCERIVVVVDQHYEFFSRTDVADLPKDAGRGVALEIHGISRRIYDMGNRFGWLVPVIMTPLATERHVPANMTWNWYKIDTLSPDWEGYEQLVQNGLLQPVRKALPPSLQPVNKGILWQNFNNRANALKMLTDVFIGCDQNHVLYYQEVAKQLVKHPVIWEKVRIELEDFWRGLMVEVLRGALPQDILSDPWDKHALEYIALAEPIDIASFFVNELWQIHIGSVQATPSASRFYLAQRPAQYQWIEEHLSHCPLVAQASQRNKTYACNKAQEVISAQGWSIHSDELLCCRPYRINSGWADLQETLRCTQQRWQWRAFPAWQMLREHVVRHGLQQTGQALQKRKPHVLSAFHDLKEFWSTLRDNFEAGLLPAEMFDRRLEPARCWLHRVAAFIRLVEPLEYADKAWFYALSGTVPSNTDARAPIYAWLESQLHGDLTKILEAVRHAAKQIRADGQQMTKLCELYVDVCRKGKPICTDGARALVLDAVGQRVLAANNIKKTQVAWLYYQDPFHSLARDISRSALPVLLAENPHASLLAVYGQPGANKHGFIGGPNCILDEAGGIRTKLETFKASQGLTSVVVTAGSFISAKDFQQHILPVAGNRKIDVVIVFVHPDVCARCLIRNAVQEDGKPVEGLFNLCLYDVFNSTLEHARQLQRLATNQPNMNIYLFNSIEGEEPGRIDFFEQLDTVPSNLDCDEGRSKQIEVSEKELVRHEREPGDLNDLRYAMGLKLI